MCSTCWAPWGLCAHHPSYAAARRTSTADFHGDLLKIPHVTSREEIISTLDGMGRLNADSIAVHCGWFAQEKTMKRSGCAAAALVLMLAAATALAQKPPGADEAFKKAEALAEKKDYAGAMRLYRIAADQGHLESQNDVGMFYLMGMGVPKNVAEGAKWLRKAADAGHPTAQRNMGFLYMEGMGVKKDRNEAIRWLKKSAAQGDEDAQAGLKALGVK
jgi:hypothetical protein